MKRIFLIALTVFLLATSTSAQNLSTEGRDFWFGFMDNWLQNPANPIILEIYISSDDSTSGVLEMPRVQGFVPIEFQVVPGLTTRLELPSEIAETVGSKFIQDKGIHISTDEDVSVYAMNKRQYSADVAVILPTFSLSNNYLVLTHWEDGNRNNNDNSDSEFLIVATEDNTLIEITPSHAMEGGGSAGIPFTITLDKGQTYQVQARGDLTGTRIRGLDNANGNCNNFAVFAGNQYTKVGRCNHPDGHDHLFAQMYPIKTWGTDYVVVDYETRRGGDLVKVLAAENNTSVAISDLVINLNAGEFIAMQLEEVNTITSNKPVAVGQFSRSQGCDGTRGDPFFIMISPNQQLLRSITFNAPTIATLTNYSMNVIAPTSDVPNVRFDGQSISGQFQSVPGNPGMSYARIITTSGNHTLLSEEGFIAYVYGYGNNESFGYATGAGLANLSLSVDIRNQDNVIVPVDSLCLHDQFRFTPLSSFEFDQYLYDFGDGNTLVRNNNNGVTYQYQDVGTYIFRLTGLDDQENCAGGSEASEVRVIKVINPTLEVRGPRSICPNTTGVTYFTEENVFYENEWFVEGGTIVQQYRDSVVVDWGETNSNAVVKLLSRNRYQCYGDTVRFPVKINIQLEPEAPFGPDSLCTSSMTDIPYDTYFTNGSTYEWKITNGEIASGQGTHEVRVNWFSAGTGKLWFDQMAQTDTICDGTSDTLTVYIQRDPDPIADLITDKSVYQVGEPVFVTVEADTLLQLYNLKVNQTLYQDSVTLELGMILDFDCPGVYDLEVEVFDTVGVCSTIALGATSINILDPQLEIIRVTHDTEIDSTLRIAWTTRFTDYILDSIELQRLDGNWEEVQIIDGPGEYIDSPLRTHQTSYLYRLYSLGTCMEPIQSETHQSMVLQLEQPEPDEAVLSWNRYGGWINGVQSYDVELSVDGSPWTHVGSTNGTEFTFTNDTLGFDYCFRIRAEERMGNRTESYSNRACAAFIPPLYPYNVITPNGDGKNDEFIIESVELYPKSRLVIFNRWGRTVLDKVGYQNDWQGTEGNSELASGVYYYVLELNEPRAEQKQINGLISILR